MIIIVCRSLLASCGPPCNSEWISLCSCGSPCNSERISPYSCDPPCNSVLLEAAALTLQLCSALVTLVDRYMCVMEVLSCWSQVCADCFEAAISLLLTDLIETSILEPCPPLSCLNFLCMWGFNHRILCEGLGGRNFLFVWGFNYKKFLCGVYVVSPPWWQENLLISRQEILTYMVDLWSIIFS